LRVVNFFLIKNLLAINNIIINQQQRFNHKYIRENKNKNHASKDYKIVIQYWRLEIGVPSCENAQAKNIKSE
jgi:hypothetical protein